MALVDGIWEYDEGDVASPTFSELLNLLGDSVRDRLAALEADLTEDTGWVSLVSGSGGSAGLAVRRVRSVVALRGEVWGVTAGDTLFTLPPQFRPSVRKAYFAVRAGGGTGAIAGDARVFIQTSGEVRLHNINTMPSASPGIDISQSWLV